LVLVSSLLSQTYVSCNENKLTKAIQIKTSINPLIREFWQSNCYCQPDNHEDDCQYSYANKSLKQTKNSKSAVYETSKRK